MPSKVSLPGLASKEAVTGPENVLTRLPLASSIWAVRPNAPPGGTTALGSDVTTTCDAADDVMLKLPLVVAVTPLAATLST